MKKMPNPRWTASAVALVAALLLAAAPAAAQGGTPAVAEGRTVRVPFSDPSRPGTLKVSQNQGSIRVEAWGGAEVQIELRPQIDEDDDEEARRNGLRRFAQSNMQMEVVEENNFMEIKSGSSWSRTVDVIARVPRRTHLQLTCVHSCDLAVAGVAGDLELANIHGSIEALNVSGTVVANTTHGDVKVTFAEVTPGRSMAFSSFHGDVDVTFPPDIKAEVRIDPGNHGDVYTAFDIKPVQRPTQMREESDGKRTRVVIEREARGTINGGGPEIGFKTWHGTIYIRKQN